MTMRDPLHAGSLAARFAAFIRSAKRLIGAWRGRAAVNRELSMLNDRLLTDIGVDSRRLREIARVHELGSPSRTEAATEVAQGAPAQDRDYRARPLCAAFGDFQPDRAGPGSRRGRAPIRLVPRGGFRA
jgi:uncharacterized protein YjiS (DUF1127 family)